GGNVQVVRAANHVQHWPAWPCEGAQLAAGGYAPEPQCLIAARRDEQATVRAEAYAGNSVAVSEQAYHCSTALHIPEPHGAVVAATGSVVSVRSKRNRPHRVKMPREPQ